MQDLNDAIACTGTDLMRQAKAFDRALDLLPRMHVPTRKRPQGSAYFHIWLLQYMQANPTDELGNYPDLVEYAALSVRGRK